MGYPAPYGLFGQLRLPYPYDAESCQTEGGVGKLTSAGK